MKAASFVVRLKLPVTCQEPFGARLNDATTEILGISAASDFLALERKAKGSMSDLRKR